MAVAPPPAPTDGQLAVRSSASPPIPVPRPSMLLDEQIPKHLLHGGVGRAANSGSKGSEKGAGTVGVLDGQEFVDGGNPQMGEDGSVKHQPSKKMAEQIRSKKLKDGSLVRNISKEQKRRS